MENKVIALITVVVIFTPSILAMYKQYREDDEINIDFFGVGFASFLFTFFVIVIASFVYQIVFEIISHLVRG